MAAPKARVAELAAGLGARGARARVGHSQRANVDYKSEQKRLRNERQLEAHKQGNQQLLLAFDRLNKGTRVAQVNEVTRELFVRTGAKQM
jgi:hypothetical protein